MEKTEKPQICLIIENGLPDRLGFFNSKYLSGTTKKEGIRKKGSFDQDPPKNQKVICIL